MSKKSAYAEAGVDIDAQDRALDQMKDLVKSTETPGVMSQLGSFGGLFRPDLTGMAEPILVSSADGVGTKLMVARMVDDYSTVGHDLVNHCVNDILVQGAEPLFFLDYVGAGILEPKAAVELVTGVAAGCRENGCALLGGETAEMPGFYQPGDYELVGTIVGLVDRPKLLDGGRVTEGDVLIGLPSSGLHTNGYSLARKILFETLGLTVNDPLPGGGGETVGRTLLATHRSYLPVLRPLLGHGGLHALAHITGGGLTDNVPRILPEGLAAVVDTDRLPRLPIFEVLERRGEVDREEMLRVFNMGVGMVVVADAEHEVAFLDALGDADPFVLGRVEAGERDVLYRPGFLS
ncbi:MAG: phosphoribosylformylglycinamidine cyclo-ligase [Acidobacteriota bacterium]